jgi:outer membrane protein assembly factor BamB
VIAPVVADGLVWVCTNARRPDDDAIAFKDWDGGVLMCFRERDGKLLWKQRTPRLPGKPVQSPLGLLFCRPPRIDVVEDIPGAALGSAPLIEGDRLWYVNNRSEVVCLDIGPLKKGTGEPREAWKLDMRKDLKIFPRLRPACLMDFGVSASVAADKDRLFVVTHNGIDESHTRVAAPDAPSLVCLEKASGKLLWNDSSPGKNILEYQLSSPLVADLGGRAQVIVGQGDGWLRSFDRATGAILWKCDLNPKDSVFELGGRGARNYIVATPVLYENRVYIATGQARFGDGPGALFCIDPIKNGDVSPELEVSPKKGKQNENSAVVWMTPPTIPRNAPRIEVQVKNKNQDLRDARDYFYGHGFTSVTVWEGLVYAVDSYAILFCFDAKTGELYWGADLKCEVWGQPLWADGKVYIGLENGEVFIFAHGKQKKQLAKVECNEAIRAGLIFANRTLFVTTDGNLFAIRNPK